MTKMIVTADLLAFSGAVVGDFAHAAIKFKRFPQCRAGLVSKKPASVMRVSRAAIIFVTPDTNATP